MWNILTSSYVVLATVAFVLIAAGAIVGIRLAMVFPQGVQNLDERLRWDRLHTLLVTLMSVGIVVRIFLAPLWFFALSSLVPLIAGGMCLASVHHLGEPYSWTASAFKAVVPAFLLIWLVMDRLDRQFEDEPFLQKRLIWLPALLVLVLVETFLDIGFFANIELGPSPCCMTLFDGPGIATDVSGMSTWTGTATLVVSLAALWIWGWFKGPGKIAAILAAVVVIAWIWALHGRLGSLWMDMPSHHCLFCVWRLEWTSVLATLLMVFGSWLVFGRSVLAAVLRPSPRAPDSVRLPLVVIGIGIVITVVAVGL